MPIKTALEVLYIELLKEGIRLRDVHVTGKRKLCHVLKEEGAAVTDLGNGAVQVFDKEIPLSYLIREYPWLVEYNHSDDMSEEYFFSWRPFFKGLRGGVGAEVGVFEGFLTDKVLKYVRPSKYYLIDPYKEYEDVVGMIDLNQGVWDDLYKRTVERFEGQPVEFIRKDSLDGVQGFADGMFDYVYLDGDHKKEEVIKDIEAWVKKVRIGGRIGGHDMDEGGVASGVYAYAAQNGILVEREYNDWWWMVG